MVTFKTLPEYQIYPEKVVARVIGFQMPQWRLWTKYMMDSRTKIMSRDDAFLFIQDTMNYVCTFMNSALFLADHALRAMSINTLQRDAEWTETCLKTQNTETLFVDEVQPVLCKLESHKQAIKMVNIHVCLLKDIKPDRRSDYIFRESNQPKN